MADLTLRSVKGSPLTNNEVDGNFTSLNTAKYESGDSPTFADIISDSIQFTGGTGTQGTISWNTDEETIDVIMDGTILQVGQEVVYNVRNNSGSLIPDGTPVMVTGSLGASGRMTIGLMDGTNIANDRRFIGITTEDIANGDDGKVTFFGKVRGINLSAYEDGDILWISTTTAGAYTNVEPTSGIRIAFGFVISNANNGTLFVRARNGHSLHESHDVSISSVSTNDYLKYDGTKWINTSVGNFSTITTSGNVSIGGDLTVTGNTTISGNLTFGDADTDNIAFNADVNSNILPNTDDSYDLGSTTKEWRNLYIDGTANIDSLVADTADINGGSIDGTTIGSTTASTGNFSTLSINGTAITATAAELNYTDGVTSAIQDQLDSKANLSGAAFTGAITTTSTIDGRDIAADGAKLDGIEAGATADQTANEILTAIISVDGADSGLDADLLDGQHGSYYTTYTDTAIANLVDSAPAALDTLNELAAALGDDANFSTTVTNSIALKAPIASPTFTGTVTIPTVDINAGSIDGTVIGGSTAAAGTFTTLNTSSNAIISVNTSSDALRITQIGSGNALVVEDSANPDSTPFIVDASGNVGVGLTPTVKFDVSGGVAQFTGGDLIAYRPQTGGTGGQLQVTFNTEDTAGPSLFFNKSRGTSTSRVIVNSGDALATLLFRGYDGAGNIQAALISAVVDGTPGTNDMPGRLVFSTTADGASSPTERMRITSTGSVGIGGTPEAGVTFQASKSITGATTSKGILQTGTVLSDVTGSAYYFQTYANTQASAFTLPYIWHYAATQGSIGAGSTVTNQYGFHVGSGITGATNNYGFYSGIPSGTGRYNLYMAGTADNYLAGRLGLGTSALTIVALRNALLLTGGAASYGYTLETTAQSDVTAAAIGYSSSIGTAASSFTCSAITHFQAFQGTIGAGSTLSTQSGFYAASNLTGATNNFGFYGTIASGTGRYNLYMAGTANNYMAGSLGIGNTDLSNRAVAIGKNITGSAYSFGVYIASAVQSDVTGGAYYFLTNAGTSATSFTLPVLSHYQAAQGTFGAGSTVTNQYGFYVQSNMTGATNNYAFYGDIASGTGRYNLYMNGTANNFLGGNLGIGATALTQFNFRISASITGAISSTAIRVDGSVQSGVTAEAIGISSGISTAAAAFTVTDLRHFNAQQGTIGAGSTVTNQYAYYANSNMTGATNNYGFYGGIASGTGRWNLYMAGTAANYLAGVTGVGIAASSTAALTLAASTTGVASLRIPHGTAPSSPVNGDIWTTTAGVFVRINGTTYQLQVV